MFIMLLSPIFRRLDPRRIKNKIPFFRIFYSTSFFITTLVLGALLLVTPGDHIQQAFEKRQVYHIVTIAAVYLVTFLVALFIYAGRMFKTRAALAAIPGKLQLVDGVDDHDLDSEKGSLPHHKSPAATKKEKKVGKPMILGVKVNKLVKGVVQRGLDRSALIAYEGHPRDLTAAPSTYRNVIPVTRKRRLHKLNPANNSSTRASVAGHASSQTTTEPIWGHVEHAGWSAPNSHDLPNLHYDPVIAELPNLFEAEAVSIATSSQNLSKGPATATTSNNPSTPADQQQESPTLDPTVIDLLQRPASMSLRDYTAHLATLSVITDTDLAARFLTLYERARFSGQALTEREFRALMGLFAENVRHMNPVSEEAVAEARTEAVRQQSKAAEDENRGDATGLGILDGRHDPPVPELLERDAGAIGASVRRTLFRRSFEAETRSETRSLRPLPRDIRSSTPVLRRRSQQSTPVSRHQPGDDENSDDDVASSFASVIRHHEARSSHSGSLASSSRMDDDEEGDAESVIRFADARESLDLPHTGSLDR